MTLSARGPSFALWLSTLVWAGCSHGAEVTIPDKPLPRTYEGQSELEATSIAKTDWRAYFADENLNALIGEALSAHPDVFIALQRIEASRAGVAHATGAMLPELTAGVGVGVSRPSRYTAEGAGNRSTEITPGRVVPEHVGDFAVGLEASWEADIWGKLSNQRRAMVAQYLATVEGLNLVRTGLVAAVASAYFELLSLDHKHSIIAQTVQRQQRVLDVVRLQKEAGRANELAVQQFTAQWISGQSLETETLLRIRQKENELNMLRGTYPQPVRRSKSTLLRAVAGQVTAGLPSALLRNRPDVRQAEQALQATKFDLQAARAAFYPRLELSAGAGLQAFDPSFLLELPGSIVYSATAGLIAPLVNRSGIEAQFQVAQASQLEAMYNMQKVVLGAFVEVTNGLANLEASAKLVSLKQQQRSAVEQTVDTADALYRAGKASYIEVLLAEQSTLEAELELIDALYAGHRASIEVYRALGGGWN